MVFIRVVLIQERNGKRKEKILWFEEYLFRAGSDNAALAKALLAKVSQGDVVEEGQTSHEGPRALLTVVRRTSTSGAPGSWSR